MNINQIKKNMDSNYKNIHGSRTGRALAEKPT